MSKQPTLFLHAATALVKEFAKTKSEHDLRLKVRDAFFPDYNVDVEDERIDFLVYYDRPGFFTETFLWAESKDKPTDVFEMFAQLLLTIKKKLDGGEMPPKYLGVFDKEKIVFTEFCNALPIFNLNDFNWTERPSSVSKKTVNQVAKYLKNIVQYRFESDVAEVREFIKGNFAFGKVGTTKAQINKNNFIAIYNKWFREVLPTIGLTDKDWKDLKKHGVSDCDFYLADLLSEDNKTISDKLNIVLQMTYYESKLKHVDRIKFYYEKISFRDKGEAHTQFWSRYERPPKQEYHKHIIERRDLLVPQDIRERKGAYFTPQIWVEKSQEYLAKVFGENWQEEYYIWDCCAGTCNLLVGLTEKHRIWASTIDQPDVDIVHEIIDNHRLNLLKKHVFQFDFLNDEFSKLPKGLREIINDPEKRKRLVIYMNPPYAEDTNKSNIVETSFKGSVAKNKIHDKYATALKKANHELFAQFLTRIYYEIPDSKIANFSKIKNLQSPNFSAFRRFFLATLKKIFLLPANTFDNVKGQFPIGFFIWDTAKKKRFNKITANVFNKNGLLIGNKTIVSYDNEQYINDWLKTLRHTQNAQNQIGILNYRGNDFQHKSYIFIDNDGAENSTKFSINQKNLVESCIYCAVRHCIESTWLNDRDQFLCPNDIYQTDKEFQNDCLIFILFHHQNNIRSNKDENHWLPFTEKEVDAKDNFQSTFMSDFLKKRKLSKEAKTVFEAGKALWRYYHETIKFNDRAPVDASLYEIREYFKGRDGKGRMKPKATDEQFNELDAELRSALRSLAKKIQPKVFEYGFLKK